MSTVLELYCTVIMVYSLFGDNTNDLSIMAICMYVGQAALIEINGCYNSEISKKKTTTTKGNSSK